RTRPPCPQPSLPLAVPAPAVLPRRPCRCRCPAAPAAGTSVRRPGVVARRTAVEGQQGAVRPGMGAGELAEGRGALGDVLERLPGRAETGEDRVEDTGAPLDRKS